jgi:hypothetical protein
MRLITDDGCFLTGDPVDLVAQLGARTRALVGRAVREERATMLLQMECDRVVRYVDEVGSAFATYAADCLLADLEVKGLLMISP